MKREEILSLIQTTTIDIVGIKPHVFEPRVDANCPFVAHIFIDYNIVLDWVKIQNWWKELSKKEAAEKTYAYIKEKIESGIKNEPS